MRMIHPDPKRLAAAWARQIAGMQPEPTNKAPKRAAKPARREPRCRYAENRISTGKAGKPDQQLFARIALRIVRDGLSTAGIAAELNVSQERIRQFVRSTLESVAAKSNDPCVKEICALQLQFVRTHRDLPRLVREMETFHREFRHAA